MEKSKYLEELGLNSKICDWPSSDDSRYQEYIEYEDKYGVFPPANWNFDEFFARWLYCYLKDYLKDADKVVDLNYYKFNFENYSYTQKEAIEKILNILKTFIIKKDNIDFKTEKKMYENYQKAIHLFAEILPALWW